MKNYQYYYTRSQHPSYPNHYINYSLHKSKLKRFYDRRHQLSQILKANDGNLSVVQFREVTGGLDVNSSHVGSYFCYGDGDSMEMVNVEDAILRLSIMERKEYSSLLEEQISEAAVFYKSTLLYDVQQLIETNQYHHAAQQLLDAMAFACSNVITFRQLLIRYDAFCRTYAGMPLNEWHLQRSVLDVDHPVHGLFSFEGVVELEKRIVMGLQQQNDGVSNQESERKTLTAEAFTIQVQSFVYLLNKTNSSLEKAVAGHLVFKDRMLASVMRMKQYLFFGLGSRGLSQESKHSRGRHFKRELKIIGKWRETKDFDHFSVQEDQKGSFKQNLKEVQAENVFPLFLNLVSCFLFMMNNYIIEPSSAYYAEALGSSDALSGIMIGMAPWFAIISSIAYSYWTNYNYKQPILFAGVLQFVGNLMYANAYGYQSIELCLIGRAVTGLGAPRVINRRYVADATPFSLRTPASAAFAMATALGAALGPGMAILLDRINEFQFNLPFLNTQYFNGMTGPGYFMSLNWLIYTICIIFFFGEPTRSGLDELKKREESDSKKESLLGEVELAAISKDEKDCDRSVDHISLDDEEDDEVDPALSDYAKNEDKGYSYRYCSCFNKLTKPVVICMSLIFMKRIALESIVGSTSIITKNRYGWTIHNVGCLHLVNGFVVIPVSIFSGYLSTLFEDRYMSIWFLLITLVGMSFLFDPTDLVNLEGSETFNEGHPMAVGPARYVTGSLIAFSGIEACESYIASLMSKVVPSALAQGTLNSGLLATLVGTGGRAVGDLFITCMGLISIRNLLNLLIIPGAALVAFSIFLIRWNYDMLAV